jgi:hypothetical protein
MAFSDYHCCFISSWIFPQNGIFQPCLGSVSLLIVSPFFRVNEPKKEQNRERAVLSFSLVYGWEEGYTGTESKQSSFVLWSVDGRRGPQEQK